MGRLMSIDYGRKRCGIAVTDPMQIVANGLTTVRACDLVSFVKGYVASEPVDKIVVGYPLTLRGLPSQSMQWLRPAIDRLRREVPQVPVVMFDERFTSVLAHRSMIDSGMKKMDRRDKAVVDEISAAILLNDFLSSRMNR